MGMISIGGNSYSKNDPKIVKDPYSGEYVLKKNISGIIVDVKNGEPVEIYSSSSSNLLGLLMNSGHLSAYQEYLIKSIGYGHQHILYTIYKKESGKVYILNKKIAKELGYTLCGIDGYPQYVKDELSSKLGFKPYSGKRRNPIKNVGRSYAHKTSNKTLDNKLGLDSPSYRGTNGLQYTFGVELETSSGAIPEITLFNEELNVKSTHDGSISGTEYVTGVLKGDTGLKQVYDLVKLLNDHTSIDSKCGMHVHIGGAIFNKEFNVFAYILAEKSQDSIFSMLPKSRKTNRYCGVLPKKKLQQIINKYGNSRSWEYGVEVAYDKLYEAMTYGKKLSKNHNKKLNHHFGRYCGQYNSIPMEKILRYKWLNFIPCNFNVRGGGLSGRRDNHKHNQGIHTLEFRNHSGTLNYEKIKNWILICMAFVYYVENHKKAILDNKVITVEQIVKAAYGEDADSLIAYIKERREKFSGDDLDPKSEYVTEKIGDKSLKDIICV